MPKASSTFWDLHCSCDVLAAALVASTGRTCSRQQGKQEKQKQTQKKKKQKKRALGWVTAADSTCWFVAEFCAEAATFEVLLSRLLNYHSCVRCEAAFEMLANPSMSCKLYGRLASCKITVRKVCKA